MIILHIMTTINEKILKLRIALELSQKDFCKILGVNQSSASDWENGTRIPPYKIIRQLSELGKEHNIEFTLEDIYNQMVEKRNRRTRIKSKNIEAK